MESTKTLMKNLCLMAVLLLGSAGSGLAQTNSVTMTAPNQYEATTSYLGNSLTCFVDYLGSGNVLVFCYQQINGVTSLPTGGFGIYPLATMNVQVYSSVFGGGYFFDQVSIINHPGQSDNLCIQAAGDFGTGHGICENFPR